MDMRRLVGRNFARIRRAKGLTQEQVAELSGFSQQYLSGLEQGRRNPTVITPRVGTGVGRAPPGSARRASAANRGGRSQKETIARPATAAAISAWNGHV